ncbi:unnamed protein product [Urochloa humidicola]
MDPSVCRLHPGVAVTGFCPACLRDRLAGLQPPSAADLRRCKSFSYARSAAAVEPQRRSCDLFRQPMAAAVPEEQYQQYQYQYQEETVPHQEQGAYSRSNKSLGGLLGRKLQQWRRKSKKETPVDGRQQQQQSCAADPVVLARIPAAVLSSLSVEQEDDGGVATTMMRSDGQIPVEEELELQDYHDMIYYGYDNAPGGTAQTRDYYLDSSSSSRRRRSVSSGRNSFSDTININGGGELPTSTNNGGNARVSPAVAAERPPLYYHAEAQSVLVHHHQYYSHKQQQQQQLPASANANKKEKQGIRGWSIWGLLHKKKKQPSDLVHQQAGGGDHEYYYPWPELRARGYNGQMLRCNSSISARSSFSGGAAMLGGSARRSVSGVDMRDAVAGERRTRRDDHLLLERTRSSYPRSSGDPATAASRPPNIPRRSASSKHHDSMRRRSTLGLP